MPSAGSCVPATVGRGAYLSDSPGTIVSMRIVVAEASDDGGGLLPVAEDGVPLGAAETVPDLVAAIAAREAPGVRWVWAATSRIYPRLLKAGLRLERCHDL